MLQERNTRQHCKVALRGSLLSSSHAITTKVKYKNNSKNINKLKRKIRRVPNYQSGAARLVREYLLRSQKALWDLGEMTDRGDGHPEGVEQFEAGTRILRCDD